MFDYQFVEDVKKLKERVGRIYIYGAGFYGNEIYRILTKNKVKVDGFIVTKTSLKNESVGIPVLCADEVIQDTEAGIVLAIMDLEPVKKYLVEQKADFSRIVDGMQSILKYRGRIESLKEPFIEVTTVIGCSVNCKFCPQQRLISSYFAEDKQRVRLMSSEKFKIFLEHSPDCNIMFAGMSEPFLNPDCTKLIEMACNAGRKVRLYTTLEGATEKDIDMILQLPLEFVSLHVADQKGYAHIKTSEDYYRFLERILNATKVTNGTAFVNEIAAQCEPDERVAQICRNRYEIMTSVHDRAGNLEGDEMNKREGRLTNEKFVCMSCGPQVNNHVLLPDGTLLLCNNDYGMEYVLGNLLESTYDELRQSSVMKTVFEAMEGNHTGKLLCDTCICAKVR